MENTLTNKAGTGQRLGLAESIALYKAFNNSFFWLNSMVKQRIVSERDAGYILNYKG